jgi:putative oxidoreductase
VPANPSKETRVTEQLDRLSPHALGALRIVTALLFIVHGTMKLFGFPPMPEIGGPVQLFSLMGLAGVLETFGGALVLIGLFTRPIAFLLSGEMAVAYFMAHAPQSFFPAVNGGDAAILYCFIFLYLVFAGAGAFSLDARLMPAEARLDSDRVRQ